MIKFLIESSICLGLFYSIYWLFLRNEKLLTINRFFILGIVILSLIIPLMEFGVQPEWVSKVQVFSIAPFEGPVKEVKVVEESSGINLTSMVYYFGLIVTLIALFIKFLMAKRRLGLRFFKVRRSLRFVLVEGYQAYSFWNVIVLGKSIDNDPELRKKVVSHEMAHIKGKHSLDLVFMEFMKCIFWFNPFMYFSATSLKTQHEYIADEHVLKDFSPIAYERSLATITLAKIDQSLVHGFGKFPIEKRIKMIYTTNSNVMKKSKLLLALPIVALLIFQFGCSDDALDQILPVQGNKLNGELTKVISGINVSMDGETKKEEGWTFKGVVRDSQGMLLAGVTVKAGISGNSTVSKSDGSFSITVTSDFSELMLQDKYGNKGTITLSDEIVLEIPTQVIYEIPDDLSLSAKKRLNIELEEREYPIVSVTSIPRIPADQSSYEEVEIEESSVITEIEYERIPEVKVIPRDSSSIK
jgi:bla regulator protein blaR1